MTFRDECHQEIFFNREIFFFFKGGLRRRNYWSTVEVPVNYFPLFILPSLIKNLYNLKRKGKLEKNIIEIKDIK
jgi:hypothetical protein